MSDASCRLLTVLFDILDEEGLPHHDLLVGTSLDEETAHEESNWIQWDDLTVMLARAAVAVGSRDELQRRAGEKMFQTSAYQSLTKVVQVFAGPISLYKAQARWISRQLFTMVDWTCEVVGPNLVRMHLDIAAPHEPFPELAYMVGATMEGLPTIIGYPASDVHWEQHGRRLTFDIKVASSRSLASRFMRLVRAVFAPGALVRELEAQAAVMERNLVELREAREAAATASRLKSEFLSMISHELRTPLNGLLGTTDLLLDSPLADGNLDLVRANRASANRLNELICKMLDFTQLCADEIMLDRHLFDPVHVVEDVIRELAPTFRGRRIVVHLDGLEGTTVLGDPARLSQIVYALLDNAIKHSGSEVVEVQVARSQNAQHWRFEVTDNGVGMPDETIARVFQPLTQGETGLTRIDGTIGLGVAMSKRLIEAMEGSIVCDSQPGQGSAFRFSVRLPAHDQAPPATKRQAIAVLSADPVAQAQLHRVCAALGQQPVLATCTDDLADFARRTPSGIVVTDSPSHRTSLLFRWPQLQVISLPYVRTAGTLARQLPHDTPVPREQSTESLGPARARARGG